MVPDKKNLVWKKLISGSMLQDFTAYSASMCLNRLKKKYSSNPSPQNMGSCIDELHSFFTKYEKILTDDLKAISK